MNDRDLKSTTEAYLEAFKQRDVERCMQYFVDDATVVWPLRTHNGQAEIRQWHLDRFAANLQLAQVQKVRVEKNKVVADVVAESDRLKATGINRMGGRVTLLFRGDKMEHVKFGIRFQR